MSTPHKHAAVIRAYAEGAKVQYRDDDNTRWRDIENPSFILGGQYRAVLPHQELRDAFERGAKIEYFSEALQTWVPSTDPSWNVWGLYRIKPKLKNQEFLDARARGEKVQYKQKVLSDNWRDVQLHDNMQDDYEYRIVLPHQDERDAYAAGKAIQWSYTDGKSWVDCNRYPPAWDTTCRYRVKPDDITFRVALMGGKVGNEVPYPVAFTFGFSGSVRDFEQRSDFIRWVGDEQTVTP